MSLDKPVDKITEDDLQYYVDEKVVETKTLEYKEALPGRDDKAKKEFLADVSSFANAAGGHIIYGIKEEDGLPVGLVGLEGIGLSGFDNERLRLDNLIRDSVKPRIPGVKISPVQLQNGRIAVLIHIPRSWNGPHAVQHKSESMRFYTRHSAGKRPLDIEEVRAAFALSETTRERIRSFRAERIGNIISGEAPVLLPDTGKVVLHLLPLSAFDPSISFDPASFDKMFWKVLSQIAPDGGNPMFNFDGYLRYTTSFDGGSYVLAFRSGAIEAVNARLLSDGCIRSVAFERDIIESIRMYLAFEKEIRLQPPVFAMLSLVGVRGLTITVSWKPRRLREARPIDRDELVIPEILVDDFEADPSEFMKPAFDQIWNACGLPHSLNYDSDGKWMGRE